MTRPSAPSHPASPASQSALRPKSTLRTLRGGAAAFLLGLNVIFCVCFLLLPVALVKLLSPSQGRLRDACDRVLNRIGELWIDNNRRWQVLTQNTRWDVAGVENLRPDSFYLVTCNHQSWVDIMVLQRVLAHRIPLLKFFLKRQLIYVPLMGFAWWALDFPFMTRASKETLAKHPERRGRDLLATRKACERFSRVPTSVLNFLEGTRFTAKKHAEQGAPYRHLLRPKAAGLALAVQALGDKFSSLLSVTILYPDGVPTFWDFLCDRVPRIVVRVRAVQIPEPLLHGDYEADAEYRGRFQAFVNDHWAEKDTELAQLAELFAAT
ncbi:MAG: acyltransferase [Polyangia bacterium]